MTLLLERAGLRSNHATGFGDPVEDADADCSLAELEGALSALLAVGVIDSGDAERWRRRYVAVSADRHDGRPVPTDVRARALQALGDFERRYECTAADKEQRDVVFRARIAAESFRAAGVISLEEWRNWYSGFNRVLGISEEPEDLIHGPQLSDVVRVVTGPQDPVGDIRLTFVELYDDGLVIRWRGAVLPDDDELGDDEDDAAWFREVDVEDDVGTVYESYGDAGGGAGEVETGDEVLGPAVPNAASLLRITVDTARFEVPLT